MSPLNGNKENGKTYWRSLEELEGSADFKEYLHREFPEGSSEMSDPFSRRGFMKVMAASFALAGGMTGCRRPEEKIMPYTKAPEDIIPGKSVYIATSSPRSRGSLGLMVKSDAGRPTKIEGLPGHPANNGSTDSAAQADILDLYNPFRQKSVKTNEIPEADFSKGMSPEFRKSSQKNLKALKAHLAELAKKYKESKGAGLSFLGSPVTSPTQLAVINEAKKALPNAKWHTWEALNDDNSASALKTYLSADKYDNQVNYDLTKAATIVALDSDFMMTERNSVKLLQDYAESRRIYKNKESKKYENKLENRFYAVEAAFSVTGSNADHRLRLKSSKIQDFAFALASKIAAKLPIDANLKKAIDAYTGTKDFGALTASVSGNKFLDTVAEELVANKGKSVIMVGEKQPAAVHLLGLVINTALGNIDNTVKITEKSAKSENLAAESIQLLKNDIIADKVETLVILDGNPVYDAPADLKFGESLAKAKEVITLTLFPTETSQASSIVIPNNHYLESWGDTRSYDGTISFVQPLIAPLFNGMSVTELIAAVTGLEAKKDHKRVQETHKLDKASWEKSIQSGYLADTAYGSIIPSSNPSEISAVLKTAKSVDNDFELIFTPDYSTIDGRYSNNGWMQELPDPITKLVWDNAALVSYKTAEDLEVQPRDIISISANGENLNVPVWVVPGMADNTVAVTLGYGRSELGEQSDDREYVEYTDRGFNAYPLRKRDSLSFVGAKVTKGSGQGDLVTTQDHWAMEDRDLAKEVTLADFDNDYEATVKNKLEDQYATVAPKMYSDRKEFKEADLQWGMVIDLNSCVGCGTCTVACQAENNIPVVGKERVSEGREMHWIRMDRYFYSGKDSEVQSWYGEGDKFDENKEANKVDLHDLEVGALHQPVPCMQCEEAPCEQVCPVAATQHSPEGLNDMVYNRCIGTRYCLNNCPFKVRRFNYFNFQEDFKDKRFEVQKMVHNPNVTVRSRGVMEKCTYCVQRINEAKIDAKVRKDESIINSFTTACAQACPTKAITFGNQNDETSAVSKMQKEARNYTLLPHLNVRPRTSFLGKVSNPSEKLAKGNS
ncbi:MAG: TAT-variant-translocated molybdopterin oxidoreductase [Lentisphaeraceae bacterium]|nr:TAT-variant-translocated molybdopterin oxidoreductase [Lentisphaeraceae bacterium]